jgi:hypothetical protein
VDDLLGTSPRSQKTNFWSASFGKSRNEDPPRRRKLDTVVESETLDLNHASHFVHHLLLGSDAEGDWPSAFIMSGGQEIGEDVGDGPPQLLSAVVTEDVAGLSDKFRYMAKAMLVITELLVTL